MVKIILVDTNVEMVNAWEEIFGDRFDVDIFHGSITDINSSAWVTPTNAYCNMNGGVDAVIKNHISGGGKQDETFITSIGE